MELRKYGVQTTIYFPLIDFGETSFESTPVTFAAGDTQFSEDGAAFGNTTNTPAHEGNGIYSLVLETTEVQGKQIVITVIDQTATKEWEDQAIVITTLNNASAEIDLVETDVLEISGDSGAADNLESDYDGTGYDKSNSEIGTCALVTANSDLVTANAVADQVWNEAVADHQTNSTFGKAFADATTPELAAVASAARIAIGDSLLERDVDNVEGSAPVHSLTGAILKLVSKFTAADGITKKTDGTTTFMTQAITTDDAADPVSEIGLAS